MHIITTTEVQKKIGEISASIQLKTYIVTKHGKGSIVMLPYFDGCDEKISEYMEDYEMQKNKEKLKKRYAESDKSGQSMLTV